MPDTQVFVITRLLDRRLAIDYNTVIRFPNQPNPAPKARVEVLMPQFYPDIRQLSFSG
jgi:hypothetical protein